MSTYDCDQSLRRAYKVILFCLSACAAVFYYVQNSGYAPGGAIALSKLVWLAYALLFWYVLPTLFFFDGRVNPGLRRVYLVFLANMLLRAVAELWMIYVSLNWHPYYGISHDVFSILLIQLLLRLVSPKGRLDKLLTINLHVVSVMFAIEAGFAWYMLIYVEAQDGLVYFVPGGAKHFDILMSTWFVVGGLTVYLWWLSRRWLYAHA